MSFQHLEDVRAVLQEARHRAMELRVEDSYWSMPSYMGTHHISVFYLLSRYLGQESGKFDMDRFKDLLLEEQLPDGSWQAVKDLNLEAGELSTTILNYWALKAMGMGIATPLMVKAREFILSRGGIEEASSLTKSFLALFRNYPWDKIGKIPYFIFESWSPIHYQSYASWIRPHLVPLSYLRENQVSKDLGPGFQVPELWKRGGPRLMRLMGSQVKQARKPSSSDRSMIELLLGQQLPTGNFDGYTTSTLLSIVSFDHHRTHYPAESELFSQRILSGYRAVEDLYLNPYGTAYRGVVSNGHVWDTALVGIGLLDSGIDKAKIRSTAVYLSGIQDKTGGFKFGANFDYSTDADSSAEVVLFLAKMGEEFGPSVRRANDYFKDQQNRDGGWAAFERGREGNPILAYVARAFSDSAPLFDGSTPDVTAHVLEALSASGYTVRNSETVRKGVLYLKKTQENGIWPGRWGVNYIYGSAAAVVALIRVGEDPKQPYLQKSIDWFKKVQNPGGGFGETTRSYDDPAYAGVGKSTHSQTAWALTALVEAGLADSPAARRAAEYLVREFKHGGKWEDHSATGTGHGKICYIVYPSYPHSFTLSAMGRYAEALGKSLGGKI